jgi:hypothetical protein
VFNVPVERVDIAGCLSHLPNAEYQRCCPPAHIAAGATTTDDGTPMSIKVEMIGPSLLIQQYVGDITRPEHWRMVSLSGVFSPQVPHQDSSRLGSERQGDRRSALRVHQQRGRPARSPALA